MNFNIRHTLLIFHVALSQWYCRSAEWSHLTLTEAFTEGIKFKLDFEERETEQGHNGGGDGKQSNASKADCRAKGMEALKGVVPGGCGMIHKALARAEECQRVLGARLHRALSYTSTGLDLTSWC